MNKADSRPLLRRMGRGLLISVAVLCLLLVTTMTAWANVGKVSDEADILEDGQVKSAGSSLRYKIDIYTTEGFSGTKSEFVQRARGHLANSDLIVMAIGVNPNYMTVVAGNRVPLSNSEADNVVNSFRASYQRSGNDVTSATVSALQSLKDAVGTGSAGSRSTNPAPASGSNAMNGVWCLIGLLILGAIAFFVIKRRRGGGMPFGRRPFGEPTYNQPYNGPHQGNYPPNYGPGYPGYPDYPQRQGGINPWVAGGLGAAAGGLLGYGLGRQQGEQEAREDQGSGGGGDFGGGEYGGGSAGDFGGGDFGGGGGGGDF